jgi:hypothetical protein
MLDGSTTSGVSATGKAMAPPSRKWNRRQFRCAKT